MFDLMKAVRQKQETQTPPTADSAETAKIAQPRASAAAESLRKPADSSADSELSATIRKSPQTPKTRKTSSTRGFRDISANPQNPQPPTEKQAQNPDALLVHLAKTLQADVHRLRALLSDDDMQDIAEGHHTRSYLLAYFRLMRSDGISLSDDGERPTP